ncbi:uncharacterized protein EAF01_004656 [Botrytis porri]|uniref:Uncharacterized protein n=1 Tax=Botrytis porri TaxID=87229 RepID=A0A4Z1KKL7_9HELO|nr:uncharacterized protein EAF01_004656 [Botrytis porri]KAF7907069.1 hypothetical protein EAF01_004656 [Botrytis porri]TGO81999.1 hypothetical protein BPOR_0949g00020 [Botrytis porri]
MNPSTPPFTSPEKSESYFPTCRTPETSARTRSISKRGGKDKSRSRKSSCSKIPSRPGSTRSHASSLIRTSPIAFALTGAGGGKMGSCYRDNPSISSSDSDSTIRERIAEAMDTNQFAMPDCDIPLPPQTETRSIAADIGSPLTNKRKSSPTTAISPPGPTFIKGVISQMKSPQLCSGTIASSAVMKPVLTSDASYTPIQVSTAPSTPSATRKPAESFLSRPVQKKTESTPLLPKRHRSSTGPSRHVVSTSAPSEFYEYHTINGIIDLPFASKKFSSGDSSGYGSGVSGSGSTPSFRTSRAFLKNIHQGFVHNVRPRVLGAYILFGGSIIWLVWMTSSRILTGKKENPGHGHGGIGGHVPPYGMNIPTLTPSFPTQPIEELMSFDEPYLFTWGVNDGQVSHNSRKSRPNPPSKCEPEESFWDTLCGAFVSLVWLLGVILVILFIRTLLEHLALIFSSSGEVADGGWNEKM